MILSDLLKPEYFFQPRVFLHRLFSFQRATNAEFVDEELPWGMRIRVRPYEEHGKILSTLGVIDLAVTETLWRLTDPSDLAVDIGANIGYMTAVMATRINYISGGSIRAFEAHPEIFEELKYNVEQWQKQLTDIKPEIQHIAISTQRGKVILGSPDSFTNNRGLASVMSSDDAFKESGSAFAKTVVVESVSLDELFPSPNQIGVMKLDVEGHELYVLKGAENLLREQRVRDCVFEELGEYPTDVTRLFKDMGYSVFRIKRQFLGPILLAPDSKVPRTRWQPTSFLATQQPNRAMSRLSQRGWKSLKGK